VIHRLAGPTVSRLQVGVGQAYVEYGGIGQHLHHVVHLHHPLQLEGIAVFHPAWSVVEHKGHIGRHNGQHDPQVTQQRQMGHSGIPVLGVQIPDQTVQVGHHVVPHPDFDSVILVAEQPESDLRPTKVFSLLNATARESGIPSMPAGYVNDR